jgi:hypothetical protein
MPRQQQLAQLATELLHAARAQEWERLQAADSALARELPQLAAQGPWTTTERSALQRLAQAHAVAMQLCADASQTLQQQINQVRESRDGWLAYALQDSPSMPEARP